METHLADWIKDTPDGKEAESILRTCVHCGFCNATCPTYQLLGDELDGPRGRIYQIKQMLENPAPGRSPSAAEAMDGRQRRPGASTQLHLDRCLTCMNCETTCPSGVRYGRLVDIGRAAVEVQVPRSVPQRMHRSFLRFVLTHRWIFAPAVRIGRAVRWLLPSGLRSKLPSRRATGIVPARTHVRKVLLLHGCVQPALLPSIDAATVRVLDALGIQAIVDRQSGCCGAIDYHMNAHTAAKSAARRNIDAWWPHIDGGAEAIIVNASGCGATVKEYDRLLADDPAYAQKASRVARLAKDPVEFLTPFAQLLASRLQAAPSSLPRRIAFHPPCTLQHTQKLRGVTESLLTALGAELVPLADAHLCCGSAGTYSLLQPQLSRQLRARKLENLQREKPQLILSANIGCLAHLEPGASVPVWHWIEWVDQRLEGN